MIRGLTIATTTALILGVPATIAQAAGSSTAVARTAPRSSAPEPDGPRGKGKHDQGPKPTVYDIHKVTIGNRAYRDTFWTGKHLQLTVMSIRPKDDIGLEMHPQVDQFIRIEAGRGVAKMGPTKNKLTYRKPLNKDSVVLIPAGTWHDVVNTGKSSLKLYSIYAPPNHPHSTLHKTKKDAKNDPLEKAKKNQDQEG